MRGLVFVLLCCSVAFGQQDVKGFTGRLNAEVPGYLAKYRVPGVGVALIRQGEVVYMSGFGKADAATGAPVSVETGFNIGSISKTVAAWGLMKLVEEGKLDLDAPVSRYLTRWQIPKSDFNPDGVTLRRLLSHTAGLSLHGYPGFGANATLPSVEESLNGATNGSGPVTIIHEPGSKWKYSGGGYTIAQLLVEEVTGQPFADYMRKAILEPLGMTHSDYFLSPAILARSAKAYDELGGETPNPRFTAMAAAGLHTTVAELALFACAALADGKGQQPGRRVLKPETLAVMIAAAPNSPNYGLGYSIDQDIPGVTRVGHGGSNRGWQAHFHVVPATGDGLVVVTNGSNGWAVLGQIFGIWADWRYGHKIPFEDPLEISLLNELDAHGLDAAIALYRKTSAEKGTKGVRENVLNNLGYQLMGQRKLAQAIAIFKLNVEAFPESSNVYDSLAEAYMNHGERELAIANYQKSLQLDSKNVNAVEMIKRLETP